MILSLLQSRSFALQGGVKAMFAPEPTEEAEDDADVADVNIEEVIANEDSAE